VGGVIRRDHLPKNKKTVQELKRITEQVGLDVIKGGVKVVLL